MKRFVSILFILLSAAVIAQDNMIYNAEKQYKKKIGNYKYTLVYEYNYQPEGKFSSYSEVLIKGNRKQYLGSFVYQLKSSTEMRVSPHNPPPIQIENKILESSYSLFNYEKKQIIVTTNYYDEKEPKEKEIRTLQQGKKGFFYIKEKQTYFKNGEIKEEKNLPEKINFVKIHF
ncbi:hypothetical protein ACKW6Q_13920 [Chryseobacterium kwangjuense]|uniref:Uncharacterized protein n=1 Tax=Chryseobacterium kwangjuense TaxID=267125 RepID=A0ABW9K7A8_9FLAO